MDSCDFLPLLLLLVPRSLEVDAGASQTLMNGAGFLSVSVEANAVCLDPILAALNHKELQFSLFSAFCC